MSLDQDGRTDSRHHDLTGPAAGAGVPVAEAVAEGLASVRLEGMEPDANAQRILDDVATGRLSIVDALERVLAAARVA